MVEQRVRIVDIADALGLSTATVSHVIHGKTQKISDETVKRVQEKIAEMNYIPNMAGILLARNNSRIIGVVMNEDPKYEGRVLEDGFIMASLNALSREVKKAGYFLMIQTTTDWNEIAEFASMWNMDGLILIGFCEADYRNLRDHMRISFVVYDGYFADAPRIVNLVIDHYDGGCQAGSYLKKLGHRKAICITDNVICMDRERIEGFRKAFAPGEATVLVVPKERRERQQFYQQKREVFAGVTAVFAVSDYYAMDFMHSMQGMGIHVPEDLSVVGFDDTAASRDHMPALTTIHQDAARRAKAAIAALEAMRDGKTVDYKITLPVELVERDSARYIERV